jgi:hypothetical protein
MSLKLVTSLFLPVSFSHNLPKANRIQDGQKKNYLLILYYEVLANICTGQDKRTQCFVNNTVLEFHRSKVLEAAVNVSCVDRSKE